MKTGEAKLPSRNARAVCVIQHVPCETPGLLADVLAAHGVSVTTVRVFKGERIPRQIGAYAGLVVMGGPMGVYEQDQYPFLQREIRLLQDALSERRPILGICLGSQLLAAARSQAARVVEVDGLPGLSSWRFGLRFSFPPRSDGADHCADGPDVSA